MSFCSECGSTLNPDSQYCLGCGSAALQSQARSFDWRPEKILSPIFGLILVCFFLPFVNLSCQGQRLMTLSGIQLVTGTTIEQPVLFGQRSPVQRVSGEPLAILAFLCAIAGLGLSLRAMYKSFTFGPTIAGIAGAVLLLLLRSKLDSDALKQTSGMLQVDYIVGFWITFVMFSAAAVANSLFLSLNNNNVNSFGKATLSERESTLLHTHNYSCSACGSFQKSDVRACSDCGTSNPYGIPIESNRSSSTKLLNDNGEVPFLSAPFVPRKNSFCSECGEHVGKGDGFCGACGARVA